MWNICDIWIKGRKKKGSMPRGGPLCLIQKVTNLYRKQFRPDNQIWNELVKLT